MAVEWRDCDTAALSLPDQILSELIGLDFWTVGDVYDAFQGDGDFYVNETLNNADSFAVGFAVGQFLRSKGVTGATLAGIGAEVSAAGNEDYTRPCAANETHDLGEPVA